MSNKTNYKQLIKKIMKWFSLTILVGILVVVSINLIMVSKVSDYIYTNIDNVPEGQVVIVLGAYVRGDNLSLVLEDRVEAALELIDNDKADRILLSGDHGQVEYDEVNSMRRYVLNEGNLNEENIFLDHAGFDTYDSMYRAKEVFGIESAIIVTQEFHIDRAVYIARELGIDAVGYSVNQDKYKSILQANWYGREFLSRVKAFFDVLFKSEPKYLGDMIPITGNGQLSWDEFD